MAKQKRSKLDKQSDEYFVSERTMFTGLTKHALFIGNKIGRHIASPACGMASWVFVRACVTAQSIIQLYEPAPSEYMKGVGYLDHAAIASLSRALIENIAVLLYIGDTSISEDEWLCRKHLIDLHDYVNRIEFLGLLSMPQGSEKAYASLKQRLVDNAFFQTIPPKRQKRLLEGTDMFMRSRHAAMLELGWGDDTTKAIYKYLSHQAHSLSMSFHRTEANKLYEQNSAAAKGVAAISTEFARKALGVGCLRMLTLFPFIEATFEPTIVGALKLEYTP